MEPWGVEGGIGVASHQTLAKECFLSERIDRSQVGDDLFAH